MDALFHVVDGAQAILHSKGVFRQTAVFHREGRIYAKWGGGYVRLGAANSTSVPHVSWRALDGFPEIGPADIPTLPAPGAAR